jgi:hypothetical protein
VIQLILFLLIGGLLLLSLGSFAWRRRAEGGSGALLRAQQSLNTLQAGLLPADMVARIFDRADLNYVESQGLSEIRDLFVDERKRVVLLWVSRVRQELESLKRFHLGSARFYAQLNLRTELLLAVDFARLLFACRLLRVFVHLRGPYAAPRIVGATAAMATKVCNVSRESLAFLTPVYAASAGDAAARPARS